MDSLIRETNENLNVILSTLKNNLDNSLKQLEVVYPAAGTDNSAVKLKVTELESIVKNEKWIDIPQISDIVILVEILQMRYCLFAVCGE